MRSAETFFNKCEVLNIASEVFSSISKSRVDAKRNALNVLLIKAGESIARGVIDLKIALGDSDEKEAKALERLLLDGVCYRISDT